MGLFSNPNLPQWLSVALQFAELLGALAGVTGSVLWFVARHSMVTQKDLDAIFVKRDEEHEKLHAKIGERFDRGEKRFNDLTSAIDKLPTRGDLEKLSTQLDSADHSISELSGDMKALKEVLKRIEGPLDILVEQKMKGGR